MSYEHIHRIIEDQTNCLLMLEKKIEEVRKQLEVLKELLKEKDNE
jgi:hypothetical protein